MRSLRGVLISLAMIALAALQLPATGSAQAADRKQAASGKTQIVAKLNRREITISDLRSEMARLGLSPNHADSERVALQSIVNRALLADAARAANLHRQPEALRQMAKAQEQALADLYLAKASHPPEPTRAEIETFMADNPYLFGERRIYEFLVLTMPSAKFDQEALTSLFDETKDFAALSEYFDGAGVAYSVAPAKQASTAFPKPIRTQLGEYDVRDNIVIKGDVDTQIMKIKAVARAPFAPAQSLAVARQAVLQERAQTRAQKLMEGLKNKSSLSYYRESVAPAPAAE